MTQINDSSSQFRGAVASMHGVSKTYRNPDDPTRVLEELDLELQRGEISCLVGPSGCGKSTIISLIAGLLLPDSGRVFFDGRDTGRMSDTQRAALRAGRIGIVLQSGNLVPFLTAAENIALAIRFAGRAPSDARVAYLLEQIGLAERAHHLPRRLSGGEAQRIAVAVALANKPDLLLADEALGQLDGENSRLIMGLMEQDCRERGLAVLLVTHSNDVAARGSRIIRLADGHVEHAP
jgi:ABC-type lipoprotein export system ATPase subunit